jgi:hypothetical protein
MDLGFFHPSILQRVFSLIEDALDLEFLHQFGRWFWKTFPQFDGDSQY